MLSPNREETSKPFIHALSLFSRSYHMVHLRYPLPPCSASSWLSVVLPTSRLPSFLPSRRQLCIRKKHSSVYDVRYILMPTLAPRATFGTNVMVREEGQGTEQTTSTTGGGGRVQRPFVRQRSNRQCAPRAFSSTVFSSLPRRSARHRFRASSRIGYVTIALDREILFERDRRTGSRRYADD